MEPVLGPQTPLATVAGHPPRGRPPTTPAAHSSHRACRPRGQCRAPTPARPRPQHVGGGPRRPAQKVGHRGGTAPDTRRPSQRWWATPPRTPPPPAPPPQLEGQQSDPPPPRSRGDAPPPPEGTATRGGGVRLGLHTARPSAPAARSRGGRGQWASPHQRAGAARGPSLRAAHGGAPEQYEGRAPHDPPHDPCPLGEGRGVAQV